MSNPEDKELFDLFGSRLTDTDKTDAYGDEGWDSMERLLDGKTRKKASIVWLYRIVSGAAAILFMFLIFNIFKLNGPVVNKVAKTAKQKSIMPSTGKKSDSKQTYETVAEVHQNKIIRTRTLPSIMNKRSLEKGAISSAIDKNNSIQGRIPDSLTSASIASVILPADDVVENRLLSSSAIDLIADTTKSSMLNDKETSKNISHNMRRMTFIVLAASDVNGVNSFSNERTGTNLAVQFSLKLTKRLSISTGAGYAVKPYQTGFGSYKSNSPGWWGRMFSTTNKPDNVTANCKVLDIPLNIDYQLYSKGRNSFMLGGGLSSYFMLSEKYNFSFANQALSSRTIQINNQNQHILGVLNLNSTYQHQVNGNLGIVVQPYLKLPLERIGFGQVDLKSAGIALGFSWNINSFRGR